MMKIIGLTGGFGCGKTTVAEKLASFPGVRLFNCDQAAKTVMASPSFRSQLLSLFGPGAVRPNGSLDTEAIAFRLFSDSELKQRLERAVHPLVRQRINQAARQAVADGCRLFVIESAILFETGLFRRCDQTVCVVCDPDEQRQRLHQRGYDDPEIDRRLASQWPMQCNAALADHVILNSSWKQLERSVLELYCRLAGIG